MGGLIGSFGTSTSSRAAAVMQQLEEVLSKTARTDPRLVATTGFPPIDEALDGGGLPFGKVHEWIGVQHAAASSAPPRETRWSPPLTLLVELARRTTSSPQTSSPRTVWVGRTVWPYGHALARSDTSNRSSACERALFVRASHAVDRLWATDLALRSRAAAIVIADGTGFDLASTRRLQLAAEASGSMCFLARPPWERSELSAAATRWLVSAAPSSSMNRQWTVELLRCKGVQPAHHVPRTWRLEQDHASCAFRVAPDILDRSGEAATATLSIRSVG